MTSLGGASLAVAVLVALGLASSARAATVTKPSASATSIQARAVLDIGAPVLACESAEDADHDDPILDVILEAPRPRELGPTVCAIDDLTGGERSPRPRATCVCGARGPPA